MEMLWKGKVVLRNAGPDAVAAANRAASGILRRSCGTPPPSSTTLMAAPGSAELDEDKPSSKARLFHAPDEEGEGEDAAQLYTRRRTIEEAGGQAVDAAPFTSSSRDH